MDRRRDREAREFLADLESGGGRQNVSAGTSRGGWLGAKLDRTTDAWRPAEMSHPQMHRLDSRLLRARARDLYENNDHAGSAIETFVNNVIRTGFNPKPTGDRFDDSLSQTWVKHFQWWGGPHVCECDSEGEITFGAMLALWFTEVLVGGGCLVHYVTSPPATNPSRTLPLSLELHPEESFADDKDNYLDWRFGRKSQENMLVNGVELTPAGRRVNYWLRPASDSASEPIAYPAHACKYSFLRGRARQYRGTTLLKRAIITLWRLGYYTDNEMLASQMKSAYAVLIKTEIDEEDGGGLEDGDATIQDMHGNTLEKISTGIVGRLRPGDDVQGVGPNVPGSDSMSWLKFIERSVAIGLRQSREAVTRDFTDATFGSLRAALNADQEVYRELQKFAADNFCSPTWHRWVGHASRRGLEGLPTPRDLAADMPGWLECKWRTPGWQSVNPYDDARARAVEFNYDMRDPEQAAADRGEDADEILEAVDRWEGKRQSLPNLRNRAADKSRSTTGIRRGTKGTDDDDNALDDPEAGRETTNSTKDSK